MEHCRCGLGVRWCARTDALSDVDGMHVLDVVREAGRVVLTVESDAEVAGCPGCGVVAVGHGRRVHRVHDAPCFWHWHLLGAELRRRGHDVVAVDLPCDDDEAGLAAYTDTVLEAIDGRTDLVLVAHSFAGFTAPLVADRTPVDLLVLVNAMIPAPGETPEQWWAATGRTEAKAAQAARDAKVDAVVDAGELVGGGQRLLPRPAPESGRRGNSQAPGPVERALRRSLAAGLVAAGTDQGADHTPGPPALA